MTTTSSQSAISRALAAANLNVTFDLGIWRSAAIRRESDLQRLHAEVIALSCKVEDAKIFGLSPIIIYIPLLIGILAALIIIIANSGTTISNGFEWVRRQISIVLVMLLILTSKKAIDFRNTKRRLRKLIQQTGSYRAPVPKIEHRRLSASSIHLADEFVTKLFRLAEILPGIQFRVSGIHAKEGGFRRSDYGSLAITASYAGNVVILKNDISQEIPEKPSDLMKGLDVIQGLSKLEGSNTINLLGASRRLSLGVLQNLDTLNAAADAVELHQEVIRTLALVRILGRVVVPRQIGDVIRTAVLPEWLNGAHAIEKIFAGKVKYQIPNTTSPVLADRYQVTKTLHDELFGESELWPAGGTTEPLDFVVITLQ